MFTQGQESKAAGGRTYVDYAFYTMLVLDATGNFFLDIGMHQTREESAPLHRPTAQLIFAYTWEVLGIDPTTPVTLCARWDPEGWVHYSVSTSESNVTLPPINVAGFPDCSPIIRRFFAGNRIVAPFPFSRYIQYFQFGVVSSESIADNHWSVDLKNPRLLRKTEWDLVEVAWSINGEISYLDWSWMWGGSAYHGVSAQYCRNPLENPYEVIFFYDGQTLSSGTVLWQSADSKPSTTTADSSLSQITSEAFYDFTIFFPIWILMILRISVETYVLDRLAKLHVHYYASYTHRFNEYIQNKAIIVKMRSELDSLLIGSHL